jgi:oligosaccharide translocation protein RFT1
MRLLHLSMTMTSQAMVKHFLTEGDKLILSKLSPLQDQGGYAIAVNYGMLLYGLSFCISSQRHSGSLVARIIFQPIEETSRVFFSKLLAESVAIHEKIPQEALNQAASTLMSVLTIQSSLTLILLVFGSAYMPVALHILLPPQYLSTSAPKVLSAWLWYIPVLAANGVLEAFLASVATPKDLNRQSRQVSLDLRYSRGH